MYEQRAKELLVEMLSDPSARYRKGQLESILACVEHRERLLIVQRTGWGKSLVYFIATKILREQRGGPTLLVSPLLSLMRNQISMAERIGIRAMRIDSTNREDWSHVQREIALDRCDVLLVSPERLSSAEFMRNLKSACPKGIGLLVVDEAHCISDWGHDFRPDYQRIREIVKSAPASVPILATTATANDRVVNDILKQLGPSLRVSRGSLMRESLRLQSIELPTYAERLVWLAENIPTFKGSGIIYCLTKRDCELVSGWLAKHGISTLPYHSHLSSENQENNALRLEREEMLQQNTVKALVATVALGMGYDKPDLGFVVHFQRPASLVAYYQQIGRAGRAIDMAQVVLLHGSEDDETNNFFINSAFPSESSEQHIVAALRRSKLGLSVPELTEVVNERYHSIEHCVRQLEVNGIVTRSSHKYKLAEGKRFEPDREQQYRITALRYEEMAKIEKFCRHRGCLMEFIARELDDPNACACGKCSNCAGDFLPRKIDQRLATQAVTYLERIDHVITPRRKWPSRSLGMAGMAIIQERLMNAPGRALCFYLDPGWGHLVRDGKYVSHRFDDELVAAAAELVRERWHPEPYPQWVTAVPSLRRPKLVSDLAARLAAKLGLPYVNAITKSAFTSEQKTMQNSVKQVNNLRGAFEIEKSRIVRGPVLLVDDIVDSRWTMTYIGGMLRNAGVPSVYPFALATANNGQD